MTQVATLLAAERDPVCVRLADQAIRFGLKIASMQVRRDILARGAALADAHGIPIEVAMQRIADEAQASLAQAEADAQALTKALRDDAAVRKALNPWVNLRASVAKRGIDAGIRVGIEVDMQLSELTRKSHAAGMTPDEVNALLGMRMQRLEAERAEGKRRAAGWGEELALLTAFLKCPLHDRARLGPELLSLIEAASASGKSDDTLRGEWFKTGPVGAGA